MHQLCLDEGSMIRIESANLPKAKDVKLKPQSTDFLAISNPRYFMLFWKFIWKNFETC